MTNTYVNNMTSTAGNSVPNQFIISSPNSTTFQSYKTTIAIMGTDGLTLDTNAMNYSRTTSKYLYQFTHMTRKELEQDIADGTIKVANLNDKG